MALFGNGVDRAMTELRKQREIYFRLEERLLDLRAEQAKLRENGPAAELAELEGGNSAAPGRTRRVFVAEQVDDLVAARLVVRKRWADAVRTVLRARAEVLRTDARKIEAELTKHAAERNRRLAAVEEWEGVRYLPDSSVPGRETVLKGGREIVLTPGVPRLSKTAQFELEIQRLHREASAIESRTIRLSGSVNGSSLEELLTAANSDEIIGPGPALITDWFRQNAEKLEREWERFLREDYHPALHQHGLARLGSAKDPVRNDNFRFAWREDGSIDPTNCYATFNTHPRSNRHDMQPAAQPPAASLAPEAA